MKKMVIKLKVNALIFGEAQGLYIKDGPLWHLELNILAFM